MNRRNIAFVVVTLVGLALDQATKWWIVNNVALAGGQIEVVPGFLSIVHAQNRGAAFGMFQGKQLLFAVFTVIAIAVILDMFRRLPRTELFMSTTLGLIMSGALGNGIDRFRQQYVTDFIRVYTDAPSVKAWLIDTFGTYEWPSFNVADSALVVGVGLFLIHYLFIEETEDEAASGDGVPLDPGDRAVQTGGVSE